ncbi:hypothetical protein I1A42_07895 [Vibrio sp. NFV-1]|uniref:Replication-associated protein G2P C-terminal domain-containing protein n=1 Tax=Vibrio nitrifigilis TaxID=2789781 RepID=A0ABS0GDI5_9VIBR|nr:hypothetical protein [Vibrio nitrifigilis]
MSRHLKALLAIGFSKAQLQNLQGSANVVPLLQVIKKVDFTQQHPSDYVEPKAGHISRMYGVSEDDNIIRLQYA